LARRVVAPGQSSRSPVGSVAASLQRFTGNPSPLVSGSPRRDTSGALAQRMRCSRRHGSPSLFQPLLSGRADFVSLGISITMTEQTYLNAVKSDRVLVCPHCGAEASQRLSFHHCPRRNDEKRNRPYPVYWVAICQAYNELSIWGDEQSHGLVGFQCGNLTVVYPRKELLKGPVPERITRIYSEAQRIRELAPNGFSVLIRRALEAICDDKNVKDGPLAARLEQLVSQEQFPNSIAGITTVIRLIGNIGAHAGSLDVMPDQARMLDDFFRFVIEFVYVVPSRLADFKASYAGSSLRMEPPQPER
jgi:hypothetical protein